MSTYITEECINCGACEPECPNTAIYQGGVEWQAPDGSMHAAISDQIFYIVPEKCTECVGFHDQEACAAVCPVDCCIPNPDIPETHDVLMARARALGSTANRRVTAAGMNGKFRPEPKPISSTVPCSPSVTLRRSGTSAFIPQLSSMHQGTITSP